MVEIIDNGYVVETVMEVAHLSPHSSDMERSDVFVAKHTSTPRVNPLPDQEFMQHNNLLVMHKDDRDVSVLENDSPHTSFFHDSAEAIDPCVRNKQTRVVGHSSHVQETNP
mmetsp:Transcript_14535/g.58969  ORF Transcript_14535/g.58969 Transcript_14535/m.58969 type:complete len:111 (-) Transcript_14535:75-407(-)